MQRFLVGTQNTSHVKDYPSSGISEQVRDFGGEGLVQVVCLDRDMTVVMLTKEGRGLLESHRRDQDPRERQAFHHGVQKPRELKHDAQLYRAYADPRGTA